MIRPVNKSEYPRLIEIWESAVRATHNFLHVSDFQYYKDHLESYFQGVSLYGYEKSGLLCGFIGINDVSIEMLFVDNDLRGYGIGKALADFAIQTHHTNSVDVNEQNTSARGFYQHLGFQIISRSPLDNDGKPYPILHLKLTRP